MAGQGTNKPGLVTGDLDASLANLTTNLNLAGGHAKWVYADLFLISWKNYATIRLMQFADLNRNCIGKKLHTISFVIYYWIVFTKGLKGFFL